MLPSLANLTNYSNVIGGENNNRLIQPSRNNMIHKRMAALKDWLFWLLIALSVLFMIMVPITVSITKNIQFLWLTIGFLCFAGLAIARFMHASRIDVNPVT